MRHLVRISAAFALTLAGCSTASPMDEGADAASAGRPDAAFISGPDASSAGGADASSAAADSAPESDGGGEGAVPVINEFVFSHTGPDDHEYVEVLADPNADLSGLYLVVLEGDVGADSGAGVVDATEHLSFADGDGYWDTGYLSEAFENQSQTLLLVQADQAPALGTDLDADDDGVLDSEPWDVVLDAVAVQDDGADDILYAGAAVLTQGLDGVAYTWGGASRLPNGADTGAAGDWTRNDFDGAGLPIGSEATLDPGEAENTPGAPNQ